MSAYVVEHSTVNRIVTYLASGRAKCISWMRIREKLGQIIECDPRESDFDAKLGLSLHMMNANAVCARYEDAREAEMLPNDYGFAYADSATLGKVSVYKSLQCFLYQCSEGDVPDTPLYKLMRDFQDSLADEIVCGLPEYDKCQWA